MKKKEDSLIQFIQFNYLPINKENKIPEGLGEKSE